MELLFLQAKSPDRKHANRWSVSIKMQNFPTFTLVFCRVLQVYHSVCGAGDDCEPITQCYTGGRFGCGVYGATICVLDTFSYWPLWLAVL